MSLTTAQRDRLAELRTLAKADCRKSLPTKGAMQEGLQAALDLLDAETTRADKAEAERNEWRDKAGAWTPSDDQLIDANQRADRLRAELDEHRAHYVSHEAYADVQAALGRCRELAEALDPEHDGHDFTHGHPDCTGCIHADLVAAIDGEA